MVSQKAARIAMTTAARTTKKQAARKKVKAAPRRSPVKKKPLRTRILQALACLSDDAGMAMPTREQVKLFTGATIGGTFTNVVSKLKNDGLIESTKGGLCITNAGRRAVVEPRPRIESNFDFLRLIQADMLPTLTCILHALADGSRKPASKVHAMVSTCTPQTFNNRISELKTRGLLQVEHHPDDKKDTIISLTDQCFPFGRGAHVTKRVL